MVSATLESSKILYNLDDDSVVTWADWAEKFVEACLDLGWTVEAGPGTPLGVCVIEYGSSLIYGRPTNSIYRVKTDIDWTNSEELTILNNTYDAWTNYNYGIDNNNDKSKVRFDIIVYMYDDNGQKIGFRVKYPVIAQLSTDNSRYAKIMVPVFCSYNNNGQLSTDKGVININNENYYIFSKTTTKYFTQEPYWLLDDTSYSRAISFYFSSNNIESVLNNNNLGQYKKFNKLNYHCSKEGNTQYFCIYGNSGIQNTPISNQDVLDGIRIICTTLEDDSHAVLIEPAVNKENYLCSSMCTTNPDLVDTITYPTRPYHQIISNDNKFYITRALLPYTNLLCKDLYYITQRDNSNPISSGTYILAKDENNKDVYYRIIPFGCRCFEEQAGEDCTYLAFPIKTSEDEE